MKTLHPLTVAVLLGLGLLASGCGQSESTNAASVDSPLAQYLLEEAPEGAITVVQARSTAQPGSPIVVAGQIGATLEPFSPTYATFVLADTSIDFCNELHGDTCPTPWDACCESKEKVRASRASVQFLADGNPVQGTLKGVGGLTELDHVVVAGTVDAASTPENLIINATGIYRQSQPE